MRTGILFYLFLTLGAMRAFCALSSDLGSFSINTTTTPQFVQSSAPVCDPIAVNDCAFEESLDDPDEFPAESKGKLHILVSKDTSHHSRIALKPDAPFLEKPQRPPISPA